MTSRAESNLREQHAEHLAKAKQIMARAELERRQPTAQEQRDVEEAVIEAKSLKARIDRFGADAELRQRINESAAAGTGATAQAAC